MSSNSNKSEQLGMPFGTANAKLKKSILFNLLKKYNESICFQCKQPIESVNELSIEHKIPWLNNDPALFWDLDNIAFSHLSCNVAAADKAWMTPEFHERRHKLISKPVDINEKWCYVCQTAVNINLFTKNKYKKDGLQDECIACRKLTRRGRLAERG